MRWEEDLRNRSTDTFVGFKIPISNGRMECQPLLSPASDLLSVSKNHRLSAQKASAAAGYRGLSDIARVER